MVWFQARFSTTDEDAADFPYFTRDGPAGARRRNDVEATCWWPMDRFVWVQPLDFRGGIGMFGQKVVNMFQIVFPGNWIPSMSKKNALFIRFSPCPGSRWSTHRVGDWLPLSGSFRCQPFGYAPDVKPIVNHNRPQAFVFNISGFQKPQLMCHD